MNRAGLLCGFLGLVAVISGAKALANGPCATSGRICEACVAGAVKLVEENTIANIKMNASSPVKATRYLGGEGRSYVFPDATARSKEGIHLAHVECVLDAKGEKISGIGVWFRQLTGELTTKAPVASAELTKEVSQNLPHLRGLSEDELAASPPVRTNYMRLNSDEIASINASF